MFKIFWNIYIAWQEGHWRMLERLKKNSFETIRIPKQTSWIVKILIF